MSAIIDKSNSSIVTRSGNWIAKPKIIYGQNDHYAKYHT